MAYPRVFTGSRLSQIRFRKGNALLAENELQELHRTEVLVASETPNISGGGIALSIDLTGGKDGLVGYRGKHHTGLIDVDKRVAYDIYDFWEPANWSSTRTSSTSLSRAKPSMCRLCTPPR